jgi:ketosteroid isomerase-like protein
VLATTFSPLRAPTADKRPERVMLSWLARRVVERNMARLRAGDYRPTLRLDADDVRFRFPGDSSWAVELEGKEELERWLRRLVAVGIQTYLDELVLTGPPWRMTLCLRGHDHLDTPDGRRMYENRYVIWGRLVWGRLTEYEVYEDTQKAKALDETLGLAPVIPP